MSIELYLGGWTVQEARDFREFYHHFLATPGTVDFEHTFIVSHGHWADHASLTSLYVLSSATAVPMLAVVLRALQYV